MNAALERELRKEKARLALVRAELAERVANNEFKKSEGFFWTKLRASVPIGRYGDEDLMAEIRAWTLEAADRFDPDRACSFKTFLSHHLYMRSRSFVCLAWRKYPKNGAWVLQESYLGENVLDGHEATNVNVLSDISDRLTRESLDLFKQIASDPDAVKVVSQIAKTTARIQKAAENAKKALEALEELTALRRKLCESVSQPIGVSVGALLDMISEVNPAHA